LGYTKGAFFMSENVEPGSKKTSDAAYYRFAVRIMSDFGIVIAVPVVIAVFGGIWLDRKFDATPWFMVIGLIGAMVSTYLVIQKKAKDYAKQFEDLNKGTKG